MWGFVGVTQPGSKMLFAVGTGGVYQGDFAHLRAPFHTFHMFRDSWLNVQFVDCHPFFFFFCLSINAAPEKKGAPGCGGKEWSSRFLCSPCSASQGPFARVRECILVREGEDDKGWRDEPTVIKKEQSGSPKRTPSEPCDMWCPPRPRDQTITANSWTHHWGRITITALFISIISWRKRCGTSG